MKNPLSPPHWSRCLVAAVVFLAVPGVGRADSLGLAPSDIREFFVTPATPATFHWHSDKPLADNVDFVVRDYVDTIVSTGKAAVANGDVAVDATLPQGYYTISFPSTGQSFGVESLPPSSGDRDPFFCMDAGLTWLELRRPLREPLVEILQRTGVSMVRERFSWGQVEPKPGIYDLETARYCDEMRQTYARHGIKVLDLLSGAPAWTEPVKGNPFPMNVALAGKGALGLAAKWSPYWGALEVWNEPNQGATVPADQYLPIVKAVSQGFDRDGIKPLVGGGVFGEFNRAYVAQALSNGLASSSDFISFHDYADATFLEGEIGDYRALLKAVGRESMPLWITECGWPGTSGVPRPTSDEDEASALQIAMKAVEAKACGVARYFPFVYTAYDEPPKSFGMIGRDVTPLRAMAAYAQTVRALSGKRYVGDLRMNDSSIKRARVFGDGTTAVAVLCTVTAKSVPVNLPFSAQRIEGADGRALAGGEAGLTITDGVAYAFAPEGEVRRFTNRDTRSARLSAIAPRELRRVSSPIVLQPVIGSADSVPSAVGYTITPELGRDVPISIRVNNLAPGPRTVELTVAYDGGKQKLKAAVAGNSREMAGCAVNLSRAFAKSETATVTVTANDRNILPVVLTFALQRELTEYLARYPASQQIDVADLSHWQANASTNTLMQMSATPDSHWQLSATFGPGSTWVYPKLTSSVDLARASGFLVRARLVGNGHAYFLLDEPNGSIYNISDILPADGQWHTRYLPFDLFSALGAAPADPNGRLDRDQVKVLQLGTSGSTGEMTLEVSDLYAVCGAAR